MVKAFRPSLEPPAERQVTVNNSARPLLCVLISVGVASLVLSAFAASGWNFYVNRFNQERLHFSAGDEVAVSGVTNDFSSFFCHSYEVKLWERGEVFLLPSTAKVNTSLIGPEKTIFMSQVPGLAYRELSLYLLDQSEVSLSACRQNGSQHLPAEIILLKGKANLRSWRKDKACTHCVEKRTDVPYDALCTEDNHEPADPYVHDQMRQQRDENVSNRNIEDHETSLDHNSATPTAPVMFSNSRNTMLNYTVPTNDRFYIIIFYGTPNAPESVFTKPGIKLYGTVKRTRFDVTHAKTVCTVKGHRPEVLTPVRSLKSNFADICTFNLPWNSDLDIVVHFGRFRFEKSTHSSHDLVDNVMGHMDPELDTGTENLLAHAMDHDGMLTKCHVRLSVWICLFGVLPAVVVTIFSLVVGLLWCRRRPPQFTATFRKRHRHRGKKKHRPGDGLVAEEVLPEGAQGSMAIQGD